MNIAGLLVAGVSIVFGFAVGWCIYPLCVFLSSMHPTQRFRFVKSLFWQPK